MSQGTPPMATENVLQTIKSKHEAICLELNMDNETSRISWENYEQQAGADNLLEGNQVHWLCCAIYAACRSRSVTTVSGEQGDSLQGNGVSLTRLLRVCNITFHTFFKLMKEWIDFFGASGELHQRIKRLSNNLAVSLLIYEKYRYIYKDLFVSLQGEEPKKSSKKSKSPPCTSNKLYEFCWYLFVCAKTDYHNYSKSRENTVDLVTSYQLLLCCVDLLYANVLEDRTELINSEFGIVKQDIRPVCIIKTLCERHDGLVIDAQEIKQYAWRDIMSKYIKTGTLKCDKITFLGLLTVEHFDNNLNALKKLYAEYVLNIIEIDEGILLSTSNDPKYNQTFQTEVDESTRQFMPETPLTQRNSLRSNTTKLTPVTMSARMVQTLRLQLGEYSIDPPAALKDVLSNCPEDPLPKIRILLDDMSKKFCSKFETNPQERFQLAEMLYYRLLTNILVKEMKEKANFDIRILNLEAFQAALIANAVEIVTFAYRSPQKFPFVLDCFNLDAFMFYKTIELIVSNHGDLLSNDVIKHLSAIEEQCVSELSWKSNSALWDQIHQCGTTLPGQQLADMHVSPNKSPREAVSKQLFANDDAMSVRSTSNNGTSTCNSKSLLLFFRKFYRIAYLRILDLCQHLDYTDNKHLQKIWTIFENAITKQFHLMKDRHLDQILMCSIYVFGRNSKFDTTFKDIMTSYRKQPQSTSDVYRDVHMSKNDYDREGNSREENDVTKKCDIIKFYNVCYVKAMQEFVINTKEEGLLSPLPPYSKQVSSPRKISKNHSLYIQMYRSNECIPQSPGSVTLSFCSPLEDLKLSHDRKRSPYSPVNNDIRSRKAVRLSGNEQQPQLAYVSRNLQSLIKDRQEFGLARTLVDNDTLSTMIRYEVCRKLLKNKF